MLVYDERPITRGHFDGFRYAYRYDPDTWYGTLDIWLYDFSSDPSDEYVTLSFLSSPYSNVMYVCSIHVHSLNHGGTVRTCYHSLPGNGNGAKNKWYYTRIIQCIQHKLPSIHECQTAIPGVIDSMREEICDILWKNVTLSFGRLLPQPALVKITQCLIPSWCINHDVHNETVMPVNDQDMHQMMEAFRCINKQF